MATEHYGAKQRFDVVILVLVFILEAVFSHQQSCPPHQHDFKEVGWGVTKISIHSKVKWVTQGKTKLIGITLSSHSDRGAVEVNQHFYIESAVTRCSKCGMATGMIFMTMDQLKQITSLKPALEPLLNRAIEAQ